MLLIMMMIKLYGLLKNYCPCLSTTYLMTSSSFSLTSLLSFKLRFICFIILPRCLDVSFSASNGNGGGPYSILLADLIDPDHHPFRDALGED